MRNQTIVVDINKEVCEVLRYKQYDNNNLLQIIVEDNCKKVNLNDYIGFAFFQLPSGLIIKKDCEIQKNVIIITLDKNILSEQGKVLLDLTLSDGEKTSTLFRINLTVEGAIDKDEAVVLEAGWDIVAEVARLSKAEEEKILRLEEMIASLEERIANLENSKK